MQGLEIVTGRRVTIAARSQPHPRDSHPPANEAAGPHELLAAEEKALRRGKGRPAAARDPSVVLLSKRRPARPWRANPFRKRPPPPMTPAAFNFRP